MSQITAVQSFQVEIDGKVKTFGTEQEARAALARQGFVTEVEAYLDATGVEGKLRAGKSNVILDYLSFQAAAEAAAETTEA